jgi:hypothetical protein
MLKIEQCKEQLRKCNLSDEEVERGAERLYQLANIFIDVWIKKIDEKNHGQQKN